MKKYLLALFILSSSSISWAIGDQAVGTNPRILLRSTNTWTAGQYMSWIVVSSCTGCGSGGGAPSPLAVGLGSPANFIVKSSPTSDISFSTNGFNVSLVGGATGYIALSSTTRTSKLGITWDGGGSALTVGTSYWLIIPASATIVNYRLDALPSGSMTVSVSTSDVLSTSVGKSICASACPGLSAATSSSDGTLTGWSKYLNKDAYLWFVINAVTTIQQANLTLEYLKPE